MARELGIQLYDSGYNYTSTFNAAKTPSIKTFSSNIVVFLIPGPFVLWPERIFVYIF
jgi:hypothetical protein